MSELLEHGFACPNCGESISMLLDMSAGDQRYIEDCEVCCRPLDVCFRVDSDGELIDFSAGFAG